MKQKIISTLAVFTLVIISLGFTADDASKAYAADNGSITGAVTIPGEAFEVANNFGTASYAPEIDVDIAVMNFEGTSAVSSTTVKFTWTKVTLSGSCTATALNYAPTTGTAASSVECGATDISTVTSSNTAVLGGTLAAGYYIVTGNISKVGNTNAAASGQGTEYGKQSAVVNITAASTSANLVFAPNSSVTYPSESTTVSASVPEYASISGGDAAVSLGTITQGTASATGTEMNVSTNTDHGVTLQVYANAACTGTEAGLCLNGQTANDNSPITYTPNIWTGDASSGGVSTLTNLGTPAANTGYWGLAVQAYSTSGSPAAWSTVTRWSPLEAGSSHADSAKVSGTELSQPGTVYYKAFYGANLAGGVPTGNYAQTVVFTVVPN
jgi:hypothetical protein